MGRLIDGDKLLRVLLEHWNIPRDYDGSLADDVEEIISIIDNFPTIEPVKGEWIKSKAIVGIKDGEPIIGCTDRCSQCSEDFVKAHTKYNFCPNCGVDMREGKDE